MIRRSISGSSDRETAHQNHTPLDRQQSSGAAALSGKSDRRRSPNATSRISQTPVILLIIFGLFGWVQWFIAVTKIHDIHLGRSSLLRSPLSISLPDQQEDKRRLVHQIQLKGTEIRSISHASPKSFEFSKDWLGNKIGNATLDDECVPMHAWQLPENAPYSCNLIHELSLDHFPKVTCGNDRCVFQFYDMQGHAIAFKIMR